MNQVESRLDDGEKLLAELVRDGCEITLVFWARVGEEGMWFLYIGSPSVSAVTIGAAARRVYLCLSRLSPLSLAFSDIKLLPSSDQIVAEALAIRDRNSGRIPIHYQGNGIGTMAIQEAYVYPLVPASGRRPGGQLVRLKKDVDQVDRPEDYVLSQEEKAVIKQLMASGVNGQQAEDWLRKWRDKRHPRPPIPVGTMVQSWVAAHWGDRPQDDPNPLLTVEAPDGARGLVFKEDTEPA